MQKSYGADVRGRNSNVDFCISVESRLRVRNIVVFKSNQICRESHEIQVRGQESKRDVCVSVE